MNWFVGVAHCLAVGLTLLTGAIHARGATDVRLDQLDVSKARQGWGSPHGGRSVEGNPITIAGRTFAHGLGTHSIGLLRIDLKRGSMRFEAFVGIDDEVKGHPGTVEFEVVGDGKPLWKSGLVRAGDVARHVDLDLQVVLRGRRPRMG